MELFQIPVCLDFVYDGADYPVGAAVLGVHGRGDKAHAALPLEFVSERLFHRVVGIEDGKGMLRDALLVLVYALVDLGVVVRREYAFVDFEDILRLGGIIHRYPRPLGFAFVII